MARIAMAAYTNYRRDPRVRREAEALLQAGHEVVFLASRQPGEPNRETIDGVDVVKISCLRNDRISVVAYLLSYATFFLMISLHFLAHPVRYRLIHINNMPDFMVFAAWLPRLLGRPVILDVHDLMPELFPEKFGSDRLHFFVWALKVQERWAGKFASAVLTVSETYKDILIRRGIPSEKIHVLMNLPDERRFQRREDPVIKSESRPFVMVYHGLLARRLGVDTAIEAVGLCRSAIPCMELRIIGGGEERSALIELSSRLGLQQVVKFSEGFVPLEMIPALIQDADVGLIPLRFSIATGFMLSTKLLEYVSMGIPCIIAKTSAVSRYFDDTMVRFFEAGNVRSVAGAIADMYGDPDKRSQLSQQAMERFGNTHKWSEHKRVYVDLVRSLLR